LGIDFIPLQRDSTFFIVKGMVFTLLVFSNLNRKIMEAQSSFSKTLLLREDFLQYLWNFQLFRTSEICTAAGVSLKFSKPGCKTKIAAPISSMQSWCWERKLG
jgi:hypothetical protein